MNLVVPGEILPLPLPFILYKWLVIFYLIGYLLAVLLRADYARFSGVNKFPTRWSFIERNLVTILIRLIPWDTTVFYLWTIHPEWPTKIALFLKVPDWLANWFTLPVNAGTALIAGFVIDIAFDKVQNWTALINQYTKDIPGASWVGKALNILFQGRLPQYDEAVVDTSALSPERKVGENDDVNANPPDTE